MSTAKNPVGRPPLEGGPDLKILNCKVPTSIKALFCAKAREQGFRTPSAKLRKLVLDDLKKNKPA